MHIVITTNSPGEVSAWVQPMVRAIKIKWPDSMISVFIPPCTFASGREVPVVASFPQVDQVYGPKDYLKYRFIKQKPGEFSRGQEGFVLFLGGDLGHAVFLGRQLNYPVYAYSERAAGHPNSIRLFFVPTSKVKERLIRKGIGTEQIRPVGDLMLDAIQMKNPTYLKELLQLKQDQRVLNILPGSRPKMVAVTLPLFLQGALLAIRERPDLQLVITLAPFIDPEQIPRWLAPLTEQSLVMEEIGEKVWELRLNQKRLILYQGSPYTAMQISDLVLALPGTNNVELAALQVPTLVILPMNWPELIPLPGVVGMIGNIPWLGALLKKKVVIPRLLPKFPYISPVNRQANREIFPELRGMMTEEIIGEKILEILAGELGQIKERLDSIEGKDRAAEKILQIIDNDLENVREGH